SGGVGTSTYRWQYSYDSTATYTDILYEHASTYNHSTPLIGDFVLRRVYTNECGTAFSNLAMVNFIEVDINEFAVTLYGDILSQSSNFVDANGDLQEYPALTQYGEKLYYLPYVITNGVSQLGSTTAKFTGGILFDGFSLVFQKGFEISMVPSFPAESTTRYTNVTNVLGVRNLFTYNVTGLQSGTVYYIRAFGRNSLGTSYGQVIRFVTK
ncbi:MAG TPA: hypothetical protein P5215_01580, partial [Bacteroidales bacterium]|nr:hypothetical protein [Bacteroidales bacterium]